jgi:CRP-like cAMP-binding protein/anti-anti-sigma regulatory factor
MSRPIVSRRYSGEITVSKRNRSIVDATILRETGPHRVILELHGVLFFGNADDLSKTTSEVFGKADRIVLDCRGISDIDVSGARILRNVVERCRRLKKQLLFCNVPAVYHATIQAVARGGTEPSIFPDLDSALEWMEDRELEAHATKRAQTEVLSLEQHEFLDGLDESERAVLRQHLVLKQFPQGATICVEGDAADHIWLLTKGSVSIRLRQGSAGGTRRIASCAMGTVVGEMAFIETAPRSASVIADEDTVCYELERAAYEEIVRDHPAIANKLLTNLSLELARRLRRTSAELRETIN